MTPRYYTGASYRPQGSTEEQATYESRLPNACEVVKNNEVLAVYAGTRHRSKYKVPQTSEVEPYLTPFIDPQTQLLDDKISIVGNFIYGDDTLYVLYADDADQLTHYPSLYTNMINVQIYYGSRVSVYQYLDLGEPYIDNDYSLYAYTTLNSAFNYNVEDVLARKRWNISKVDLSKTSIAALGVYFLYNLMYLDELILPASVTTICDSALAIQNVRTNQYFKNIVIPNSVTHIGNNAFYGRVINSIVFPNGLLEIGNYAFANGNGFTTIEIPSSISSIGASAFSGAFSTTASERILRIHKTEDTAPEGAPWGATNATIVYDE